VWDADRVQMVAQAIILRDNGYTCTEAVVYSCATKQRVRIAIDDNAIGWAIGQLQNARAVAAGSSPPPPLIDSPKCPRCSLVGICLPDETRTIAAIDVGRHPLQATLFDEPLPVVMEPASAEQEVRLRKLLPARDDLRPLYLNTPGIRVGKSGGVLKVQEKERVVQEVRINGICQLNLFGNVQISTQAIQSLCEAEIPIAYFSMGGWFYGITQGIGPRNAMLRREQFRRADSPSFCVKAARAVVAGKIRNQRTLLQRNHADPPAAGRSRRPNGWNLFPNCSE
jgi:CRISPR-associated protein Cas1